MSAPRYPSLFQVNTRVRLSELTAALGRPATLDDITQAELDQLARDGFDLVWFLGVWQTGEAARRVSATNPEWLAEYHRVLPDFRESDVAAEIGVDVVVADGKAGPGDVGLPEVRQDTMILRQPLGIRGRHAPGSFAGLPDAEEPDQVEPIAGELVELRVGDVVQGCEAAQRSGQLRQADAGVDLE